MNGRLFYVNKPFIHRPFIMKENEKNAFFSILNLSPNTNTNNNNINQCINNHQNVSNSNVSTPSNVTSFKNVKKNNNDNNKNIKNENKKQQIEVNMTENNKQYNIFMNKEYPQIIQFLLITNLNCPLYIPSFFDTALNPEQIKLSNGAKKCMYDENAGGNSELSEGFSFEFLYKCFNATLLKTEMEIKYMWFNHWKKTDYSIKIGDIPIGVSVTRAMKYNGLFNKHDAMKLLTKKLNGVRESTEGVLEVDQWQRQILHIWATDQYIERILHQTFLELLFNKPDLVGNTVIVTTVASQEMWWIFYQDKYFKKNVNKKKTKKKVIKKNLLKNETDSTVSPKVISSAVT